MASEVITFTWSVVGLVIVTGAAGGADVHWRNRQLRAFDVLGVGIKPDVIGKLHARHAADVLVALAKLFNIYAVAVLAEERDGMPLHAVVHRDQLDGMIYIVALKALGVAPVVNAHAGKGKQRRRNQNAEQHNQRAHNQRAHGKGLIHLRLVGGNQRQAAARAFVHGRSQR